MFSCVYDENTVFRISDIGFQHILEHHGSSRSEVYRRIFQVLWFGNQLGKKKVDSDTPTYVYPEDLRLMVPV